MNIQDLLIDIHASPSQAYTTGYQASSYPRSWCLSFTAPNLPMLLQEIEALIGQNLEDKAL